MDNIVHAVKMSSDVQASAFVLRMLIAKSKEGVARFCGNLSFGELLALIPIQNRRSVMSRIPVATKSGHTRAKQRGGECLTS
jgi:hypothetical protein